LANHFLEKTSYWRNEYLMRLLYSQIHHHKNIRTTVHLSDTIRYLLQIALGVLPGFRPAQDESYGPIGAIQNAYYEVYGLKYAPILMQPDYFNMLKDSSPIYASLQHNCALELAQKTSRKKTALTDLYDLHAILKKYQAFLANNPLELSISALSHVGKHIEFGLFHSHTNDYPTIQNTLELPKIDNQFANAYDLPFPQKSHFLNGCVQIKKT
jgi:hypothetical protein